MTVTPSFPAPVFSGPRIEAAIIDLDGTMIDTADDFTAGLNGMLAQLDAAETSREEVVEYVGKGSEHLIRSVLAPRFEAGHAQDRFDEALAIYQEEYSRINGTHTRLYPDVEAGLKAMRDAGLKLACVTNKPRRFAVQLLTQYGLIGYFSVVIGGDTLAKKKPDPLPMITACAEMQVAPQAAVAIGDSENDAMAGRAAGLATLTVPYGYNHGQSVQTIKSDGIVASLLEAAKAIAAHQSPTL
ncbi:phosphoglycolate phosphatase [Paraburkholderia saeva]|uniref:Phosphoglycolate phosphatase n=1 Tax=Paraburkholderia saeva TaxID=2777537 RepID=A0A9N8S0R9_9BURK|nr:phosphoglycolate phosphatase [Paraburkholderia saeva]CAG4917648.1 Phosphoglycolate phosphatase, chromosomal [Paraburkholderia saeva]CAG4918676.1 Phosphoglycolate phosphatase, chromosomal [Paraburkholderia saeva]CAG4927658.1 Phosphoglycolate phosphatase, chromosomal [Paraburkholderia saeva]